MYVCVQQRTCKLLSGRVENAISRRSARPEVSGARLADVDNYANVCPETLNTDKRVNLAHEQTKIILTSMLSIYLYGV